MEPNKNTLLAPYSRKIPIGILNTSRYTLSVSRRHAVEGELLQGLLVAGLGPCDAVKLRISKEFSEGIQAISLRP